MIEKTIERKLDPQVQLAVIDLLYRLADDHLVLGHRNSEWTGLAPILEADIAFSSMAQDKMGHALTFYKLLHELGEDDPDTLAFLRSAEQYRCCSLVALERGDWALSVVRHFLFDEGARVRFDALANSTYAPLADVVVKLRGELKYHVMHGRMNIQSLGEGTQESHDRIQATLDRLYPHALGMFEPTQWEETLAAEGIQPPEHELCETWQSHVLPLLEGAGLKIPTGVKAVTGGRQGQHTELLEALLDDLQKVYRLDPAAKW